MVAEDQMKAKVILYSLFIDPSYKTGMLSKQLFKTENTQWPSCVGLSQQREVISRF